MSTKEEIREVYANAERVRLTPEILMRHRRAVERIQAELFDRRSPQDYFIRPGTPEILPPSVPTRLGAEPMLGGVRYEVESVRPHHRLTLAIAHSEESRFTVFLSIEERARGGSYTRFAVRTDFRELDSISSYNYSSGGWSSGTYRWK